MAQNQPDIEQLISRKLAGELSPAETERLFNWIGESEANANTYRNAMHILGQQQRQFLKNAVWSKVKNKSVKADYTADAKYSIGKLLKVAAVLVLIVLIPLALGKFGQDELGNGFVHTVKGNDVVTSFYLPDGSKVFLSRGSEISYNDGYNETNRELQLKGKAYIEISSEATALPVIVNSGKRCAIASQGKLAINGQNDRFDVAVNEGEATVVDTVYKKVIIPMFKLTPATKVNGPNAKALPASTKVSGGQRATYSSSDEMAKTTVGSYCEVFSWKDKVFCFSNLKQHELAFKISEWYGKSIEFKGELDPYQNYSGSFDNPSAEDLINTIFSNQVKDIKETKRKITVIFS
ncbi:FecR family protein [Carboxylicivirga taeanensis]|uniref:FecR family protein n=1 Tax=Carboxylicivirga taeanensis TaxID=1416875 RepID=UPI003F6DE597